MKRMMILDWNALKCFHLRIFLIPVISLAAGVITPLLAVPVSVFMFLFFFRQYFCGRRKRRFEQAVSDAAG